MSTSPKTSIAFFDFDGTITNKDIFLEFLRYSNTRSKFWIKLLYLSPVIFLYLTQLMKNSEAKKIVFKNFFKGFSQEQFSKLVNNFSKNSLPDFIRKGALDRLSWHKNQGHQIVIVSANFDLILQEWCTTNGFKMICTCLEVEENKLTGNFTGENCYGKEKVRRIKASLNLSDYERIYSYGDSKGDTEMLEMADERFYKPFRN